MIQPGKLRAAVVSLRRQIHKDPELGNMEVHTTELIKNTLKCLPVDIICRTDTGLVAVMQGRKKQGRKKCIALRADIDALPILEKTGKPYASRNPGVMHACGHDANTAMVFGALLLLSENLDNFSGTVKFIFQPNEESSGGAQQMIKSGVLQDPKVDAIVGIHVNPWLKPGVIGLKRGEMMAAVDRFKIELIGEGGHGAYPHLGKDPVLAASQIVSALQGVVSREIDPVEPAVITVGTIHGGEAFNILANKVTMTGTARSLNEGLHKLLPKMIENKVSSVSKAFGLKYDFKYEVLGYPLINSDDILELSIASAKKVSGEKNVAMLERPSMGGEDFAEYLQSVPGCFVFLGACGEKVYPWHNERFDIDESVLPAGSRLLAQIVKDYLEK
jgi:amidohydrolase